MERDRDRIQVPNALVGGTGLGTGHMTTLTSFNVSAIDNNLHQVESPNGFRNQFDNDINSQEHNELY